MEILERFCPDENAADMGILYEVTGFQAESQNFEYWDNYQDFEELGESKLVRQDKDEHLLAHSSRNDQRKKITFEEVDVEPA